MFKYICVLDFEATCESEENKAKFHPRNEIIEFPSVLLKWDDKVNNYVKQCEIQLFCKPLENIQLTKFCKDLTGITQNQVDNGINFPDAITTHYEWLVENTDDIDNVIITTCGKWDLITMLPDECRRWNYMPPNVYRRVINIQDIFKSLYTLTKGKGMKRMLETCKIPLEGRHHSGIDDCRNIAKLAQLFTEKGHVWNDSLVLYTKSYEYSFKKHGKIQKYKELVRKRLKE